MIIIGKTIVFDENGDQFKVVSHAGSGGFGEVYKIEGVESGDVFALKTMNTSGFDTKQYESLVNEAQMAMGIDHENVLKYHYFHDGETYPGLPPYIIMDFASNGSLLDFIKQRSSENNFLSPEEIKGLTLQILKGAKAVNDKILHRDLHPGNILLDGETLKVTDFGLSKVVDNVTRSKTFKGITHLLYKAPESWKGERNEIQLDMYAVGISLYQLSCLSYPYEYSPNISEHNLMNMHLLSKPRPIKMIYSKVPSSVQEVILRLMNKNASSRFKSWDEAIEVIENDTLKIGDDLDLSEFLNSARVEEEKREAKRIESDRKFLEQKERNDIFKASIDSLREEIIGFCEQINKMTKSVELEVSTSVKYDNGIYLSNKKTHGKEFRFTFHQTHPREISGSVRVRGNKRVDYPRCGGKELVGWGVVDINGGQAGFNLLMIKENDDDLYPEWHLMSNKASAIVRDRRAVSNNQNPECFALKQSEEFFRFLSIHYGNVMSTMNSEVRKLDMSVLKEYFNYII